MQAVLVEGEGYGLVDLEPGDRRDGRLEELSAGAERDDQLDAVVLDVVDRGGSGPVGADQNVLGADAQCQRAGVPMEPGSARGAER